VFPDGSASYESAEDHRMDFALLSMIVLDFEPLSFVNRSASFC
jgi:hypothetical protein